MPFEDAQWIAAQGSESPQFRGIFSVNEPSSATIRICGLGFFELWINGQKVSDDLLVLAWSDYAPRSLRNLTYPINDRFSHRTYYLEYDLLPYLRSGENVLGAWLGNGWYNQNRRTAEGILDYGKPTLCFSVKWQEADGSTLSFASGEHMLWRQSEIIENNIYMGEVHDLSLHNPNWCTIDGHSLPWQPVQIVDPPQTNFQPQDCPPDRVIRTISPTLIFEDETRQIYDCRENISGWAVLDLPANPGAEVTVRYSEEYDERNHALDFESAGGSGQVQTNRYIASDAPTLVHPRFGWHGFRYFQLEGIAQVREVQVVHSDHSVTSRFASSNPTLNWLYEAYLRSQLTNIHCGVPSDCPHRERLGYTGDGQLTAQAAMLCLDVRSLYIKWMRDIADGQDPTTGHVQHTAPFYGGGGGPGGWGSAIWIIPWQFYMHYGDDSLLREYLPAILKWLDYMESRSEEGLVVREEEGGWCLGEWCAPNQTIPEPYVNTYYYIKGLETTLQIGRILNRPVDDERQDQRIERARTAITSAYHDPDSGSFCAGANGADAFALDIGLGDERTKTNLITRYRTLQTFDTGMFGTDLVIDQLFRLGEGDLAFSLLTNDSPTSFERMRRMGATTIWETWDASVSHNHPMFGGVVRNLFTHILGIRQAPGTAGFSNVTIKPMPIAGLEWVKGSIATPQGTLSVEIDGSGKVTTSLR